MSNEADDSQFTGKYEKAGKIGGALIERFYAGVAELLSIASQPGDQVLEVGAGAGFSTQRLRAKHPALQLTSSEFGASLAAKCRAMNPTTTVLRESVYQLAHPDQSFDGVVMLEVLEHLDRPDHALQELRRVARKFVILSTPREPLWRLLNMARLKYLADFGNTPGHINHWSTHQLARKVAPWFDVVEVRTPVPWSILLLRPKP